MRIKTLHIIRVANLPRRICIQLLGHHHDKRHRMVAGFLVMMAGVGVAKGAVFVSYEVVKYMMDLLGYGIHGLGLTPFIEALLEDSGEDEEGPKV